LSRTSAMTATRSSVPGSTVRGTAKWTDVTDSVLLRSGKLSGCGCPAFDCGITASEVPAAARTFSSVQPSCATMSRRRLDVELDTVTVPAWVPSLVTRGTESGVPTEGDESSQAAGRIARTAKSAGFLIRHPYPLTA